VFSVLGVGVLSVTLSLTTQLPALTHDTLLAVISAGVLSGIGMGIIFRSSGSLGGTDILGCPVCENNLVQCGANITRDRWGYFTCRLPFYFDLKWLCTP